MTGPYTFDIYICIYMPVDYVGSIPANSIAVGIATLQFVAVRVFI